MRMTNRVCVVLAAAAILATACAGDPEGPIELEGAAEVQGAVETVAPATEAPDPIEAPEPAVIVPVEQYYQDAEAFQDAPNDASLPPFVPDSPAGVYGFSRYVFQNEDDGVVPTLIEGPRGQQVRCQEVEQLCSYLELKELHESGEEIPDYLGMDRDELGELVEQLDIVEQAVNEFNTIEEACAAGFSIGSSQNPNMGIHATSPFSSWGGFDPAKPQMVLYARDGGELLTQAEQGDCVGGEWTGDPGYESVGAVFTTPMTEEHPDAFAGPIDNWHIHYNTCAGSPEEGGEDAVVANEDATLGSRERCEASGGAFMEIIPVWMMHAYVDPDYDAQGGVFAMFNPAIWPLSDPDAIAETRTENVDGATTAPITNFDFGEIRVGTGESVVFTNSDSVPHTVTGGLPGQPTGEFDSGVFGTGQTFETSFDAPGEYALFCVLHPQMTGTITVE
ncbi:MAG: hypothetical protein HKN26_09825 [Acidimicrobiales bacterium]|nr:hypothetical protein [Acidimicrobiales bacterium]